MGLFDHLFKPKPDAPGEKSGEALPKAGESEKPQADPSTFLHPKGYGAGSDDPFVPIPPAGARPAEKKPAQDAPGGEVMLTLGDILPRIPTHFLRMGLHDLKRELRFDIDALSPDIARGRASVPISKIAALCPDIFHGTIGELEDIDIRLPLQKLVEQIGRIRAGAHPRAHGSEAPGPAAQDNSGQNPPPIPDAPLASAAAEVPRAAIPTALAVPEPSAAASESEIHLSVAALLPGVPQEILAGPLPQVDENVRITLPFAPVERQLAGGKVEVSSRRFVSVLPPELQPHFIAQEGVKVPLPLEEIFQNLPPTVANPSPIFAPPLTPDAPPAPVSSPIAPPIAPSLPDAPPSQNLAPAPEVADVPCPPAPPPPPVIAPAAAATHAAAPSAGFAPPVQLPPVRLFAPPPPLFAAAPTAPPPAEPAAREVIAPIPAPEPALPEATETIPASSVSAPAPTARVEPERAATIIPPIPAPMHLKPAAATEPPAPVLHVPIEPVPTAAPAVRPLVLQPPMLFAQSTPVAPPPVAPESVAPVLPVVNREPVPPEPAAQEAPILPLPIPPAARAAVAEPLPPAISPTRFDQENVQALFMTEEVLDLQKISRLAASLPGVQACVIATRETAVTGGLLPEGFDVTALLGLAPRVGEAASRLPIGGLKHFTLYGEKYSVSFFERQGLCVCAVHRPRSFVPGVREKLVALADELAG